MIKQTGLYNKSQHISDTEPYPRTRCLGGDIGIPAIKSQQVTIAELEFPTGVALSATAKISDNINGVQIAEATNMSLLEDGLSRGQVGPTCCRGWAGRQLPVSVADAVQLQQIRRTETSRWRAGDEDQMVTRLRRAVGDQQGIDG